MIWLWFRGLGRRRGGRLLATAAGVAIAVALVASLGSFLTAAQASMTSQAARGVAVDWQVELGHGADVQAAQAKISAAPGVGKALPVQYATATGFRSAAGGSTQTTGTGIVLGLPDGYADSFPAQIRTLAGSRTGVLIAQQTASNLHARPGDTVSIQMAGTKPVTVTIDGVVDLPQSNSLFQKVGAPPQSQPQAPPDNVMLLPTRVFAKVEAAASRPDLVTTQIHVSRSAPLPADPSEAFTAVTGAAHNLEAALAGAGTVGNNLGAALDAARADAAYANVLFLFLGLPGAVLAGILSMSIARTGTVRRRREQALLRARGATSGRSGPDRRRGGSNDGSGRWAGRTGLCCGDRCHDVRFPPLRSVGGRCSGLGGRRLCGRTGHLGRGPDRAGTGRLPGQDRSRSPPTTRPAAQPVVAAPGP